MRVIKKVTLIFVPIIINASVFGWLRGKFANPVFNHAHYDIS